MRNYTNCLNRKPVLTEGVDYYLNEQGLMVLTAKYHLDRGYCCGRGCLHCPFDHEKVPEPRRSEIKAKKKEQQ